MVLSLLHESVTVRIQVPQITLRIYFKAEQGRFSSLQGLFLKILQFFHGTGQYRAIRIADEP